MPQYEQESLNKYSADKNYFAIHNAKCCEHNISDLADDFYKLYP